MSPQYKIRRARRGPAYVFSQKTWSDNHPVLAWVAWVGGAIALFAWLAW